MRQPKFPLVVLFSVVMGAGCNPTNPDTPGNALNAAEEAEQLIQSWRLEVLRGKAVDPTGGKGMASRLHLMPDGEGWGFGGCNQFSITYEQRDGDLSFGTIVSTKVACPGMMDMERGFFSALDKTSGYRIGDGRLELLDAQGSTLARLQADDTLESPGKR